MINPTLPGPVLGPAPSQRGIILVEEYDGLAAAIGAALKKFAPEHKSYIVRTLAEAERIASQIDLEVCLLDVDPPHPRTVDFLVKMQSSRPDLRVLVLAGAAPPLLKNLSGHGGALHFIEKPFQLACLGTVLGSLLGPAPVALAGAARRSIRDLQVIDVVLLQSLSRATSILKVKAFDEQAGEIHFSEGEIVHASAGKLKGAQALPVIFSWKGTHLTEVDRPLDASKSIDQDWRSVLKEATSSAEPTPKSRAITPASEEPESEPPRMGKKILVIDDTDTLRLFVADILSLGESDFQISTAQTGAEGLKLCATTPPDLILLDFKLPDLNGNEVCQRFLDDPATHGIPVVMMSGHVAEMNAAASKYENIAAAIAKPFLSAALVSVVENIIANPWKPKPPTSQAQTAVKNGAAHSLSKPVTNGSVVTAPMPNSEGTVSTEQPVGAETPVASHAARHSLAEAVPPLGLPAAKSETSGDTRKMPALVLPSLQSISPAPERGDPSSPAAIIATFALDIVSMQLTPIFRVGTLLLAPRKRTAALKIPPGHAHAALAVETGFELGTMQLRSDGGIDSFRLTPRRREEPTDGADFSQKPQNGSAPLQLTSPSGAPMTVQMSVSCEVTGVELSSAFDVSALVLKASTGEVRAWLGTAASSEDSNFTEPPTPFKICSVRLDEGSRLVEVKLQPPG